MVVEPASASDAAVRADHTANRRGQQLGKEEASNREEGRQAERRRGSQQSGGEEASSQEERRQAVGRRGGQHSGEAGNTGLSGSAPAACLF